MYGATRYTRLKKPEQRSYINDYHTDIGNHYPTENYSQIRNCRFGEKEEANS